LQARPPAKPARHSPEAKPMADGQGEAAWGTSGQVTIGTMELWNYGIMDSCRNKNDIVPLTQRSTIPKFQHSMEAA